ncbi:uncharacterized protein LOC114395804 isoform X1 [Glycine soja]|nr:uncharacterized protein LOC114395804 isoform X1 [Glycine soja]XP_028213455.1 uncharacterized protein LOC114395804 isoform X1 [Glycine soja]XP_028213456.1 uncharacterized protein LOC114395804 isoform X1 [Glycine soja]XP_028213457.1 uncharacterized protein LOC114395804 isoform X1 [Glycine soja]XP_028213458.1 uncharacterized protein LOC114395804 isoform X1 [Glycine soja]
MWKISGSLRKEWTRPPRLFVSVRCCGIFFMRVHLLHDDINKIQLDLVPMLQEIIFEWLIIIFFTITPYAPAVTEDFNSKLSSLQIGEKGKFNELLEDKGVNILIDPKALMNVIGTKMDFVDDKLRFSHITKCEDGNWAWLGMGKMMTGALVEEGALTALASIADSSEVQFQKYYDVVMPYLKAILVNANDKSNRMLRAKAMECISLVGMAVGKEKFRDDAKQVMDVLMSLQQSQLDADDPTASYILQAWARLCKCLGQDFLPYMGFVMPPLLQSAQLKPDVTITSTDSDTEFDEDDDRCPFSYCY